MDYFAQDQASVLNPARTVYEEMSSASPTTMVPMIRSILGGFLFSGDDAYKKAGVLSGGERNRLALAKMLLNPSNVLLLDEPTNHLDLDSKEVLLDALADYGGTLVFVSHDRYFVDNLATKVIEIGAGQALLYPGGYEDFLYWKKQREAGLAVPLPKPGLRQVEAPKHPPAPPTRPATVAQTPVGKPKTKPAGTAKQVVDPLAPRLRKPGTPPEQVVRNREANEARARIAEIEKRIAEKEKSVQDLESQMAAPGFYDDRARADAAANNHKALMWEVGDLMSQWEMLQEAAESKA
jgi:ATP-binding cassette subfamily F protein 3